ncbi:MAG TPA: hypothetical protein VFL59_09710 [Candidatus Nanopelagicales bacterium]|nr:hypothetical protein [Candidatus Nanopelagicales bacterium]
MTHDGRLDLDDLGEVIDGASALDEVIGTEHQGPTFSERLDDWGVTPFLRRHRVPIASVVVVALAVAGLVWARRDTRPPDDGSVRATVTDSASQSGIDNSVPGVFSTIYTVVRQQVGDDVELLGIDGPGIRASSVGTAVKDEADATRTSTPVLAVPGCEDPRALTATEDQYRLRVRRTDPFGRTVEADVPMPLGSQVRWDITIGGYCLQTLAARQVTATSVGVRALPSRAAVELDIGVRSTLGPDIAIDVQGYSGMRVRPDSTSVVVPGGGTARLRVTESVEDCSYPHIDTQLMAPDGQSGYGVTDRGLDLFARPVSPDSTDETSATIQLKWSAATGREVAAALASVCTGMPAYTMRVVSSGPAPAAVVDAARSRFGDPSATVVRSVVEVRTRADRVGAGDILSDADLAQGNEPNVTVMDVSTGRVVSARDGAPATLLRPVGGVVRLAVDWPLTCAGGVTPPSAKILLGQGARTWQAWLALDDRVLAEGVLRACPTMLPTDLANYGWTSYAAATS